jgi:hypothetical protein
MMMPPAMPVPAWTAVEPWWVRMIPVEPGRMIGGNLEEIFLALAGHDLANARSPDRAASESGAAGDLRPQGAVLDAADAHRTPRKSPRFVVPEVAEVLWQGVVFTLRIFRRRWPQLPVPSIG